MKQDMIINSEDGQRLVTGVFKKNIEGIREKFLPGAVFGSKVPVPNAVCERKSITVNAKFKSFSWKNKFNRI